MTKKKPTTTKTTTTAPDQTPEPTYEQQIQQVRDEWPEKALELLEADVLAVESPEGAREVRPETSEGLLRDLRNLGGRVVESWVVLPPRPKASEYARKEPSEKELWIAEQRRQIEAGSTHTVDERRPINEDRKRAGKPLLPDSD